VGASSDRSRLDVVYREQFARLMRVAYLMMGSNDIAEDLVHDVFVRCSQRLGDVDDPASYLRACVVNACRREHRRRARLEPLDGDSGSTNMPTLTLDLRRALWKLGVHKRAAVVLRFYADLPFDEVAGVLGCRPATARSLVRRAMKEMRDDLDER